MKINVFLLGVLFFISCNEPSNENTETKKDSSQFNDSTISVLFENYYDERLELFPLEATAIGVNTYNDKLPADFTEGYRDTLKNFFNRYLAEINIYDRESLNASNIISYDIFKREIEMNIEGLKFHDNYIPFNQFYGLTLTMGQLGSGSGMQPFKTVEDYDNWVSRASKFSAWTDSAIVYFKKGMDAGYVLPKSLVEKMIPQMHAMVTGDVKQSLFYDPVKNFPQGFSAADKKRLQKDFTTLINQQLVPSYKKLDSFLQKEYLPNARTTTGISDVPNGRDYYNYLVRLSTTTNKNPEEIYQTGLSEVARIRGIMDSIKNAVGFKGDLQAFFEFMKTDKQFTPYKTPKDVLGAFENIHTRMQPYLKTMFVDTPKTKFEIRQTEAFRAASASAEYNQGSPDGSRPGIFYVPILDATTFNTTSGMESLFLHEAIPGHHYQISLQQEDTTMPRFRRFGGNNAYIEGWALYSESLGKELGLYQDPYQYMGALGDEIHRAIRLVVDVALHTKGMTREEAIKYMMDNEAISEQGATAEIERYMAIPSQALGYKIGALKIQELRNKYQNQLKDKFNLAEFHTQILKDGAMPLEVLDKKMDAWAKTK